VKKIMPEEISVQRRHDGPSDEIDRRTLTALLNDSWKTSTLGRRKTMQGLLGGAAVLFGLVVVAPLGGMIRDPWRKRHELNYMGDGTLWTSGWTLLRSFVAVVSLRCCAACAAPQATRGAAPATGAPALCAPPAGRGRKRPSIPPSQGTLALLRIPTKANPGPNGNTPLLNSG